MSNQGLDNCNGKLLSDGVTYAYFATPTFPYLLGCFGPGHLPKRPTTPEELSVQERTEEEAGAWPFEGQEEGEGEEERLLDFLSLMEEEAHGGGEGYVECPAGSFLSRRTRGCELCPAGRYGRAGATSAVCSGASTISIHPT